MRISKKTIGFVFIALAVFTAAAFLLYFEVTDISRNFELSALKNQSVKKYQDTVYIGVVSRFTPEKIYEGYQPIMDYLSEKSNYLFELKLSSSYRQTLRQLNQGKVTAAFFGSYIFIKEMNGNLKAVLKPLDENGKPFFRSALIVKENSDIYTVKNLAGKRVALPSPMAFSGNWLQKIELKKFGLSDSSLKEIKHFNYHNSVVRQVLMGNFDAGVVKDRVAKEFAEKGIRVVAYSEPIPGSPIVISRKSDKAKVNALVKILLASKNDKSVKDWDPEFSFGFVKAKNEDYLGLKKMIPERN
ncbi:MAG: PhnD/SsuA/transferrin family substrate-binding protein [Chlorobi bacterium]|nr:PhnD/SsuA/transferrin family substrate-binding protein [Chlorobiota bacterium]